MMHGMQITTTYLPAYATMYVLAMYLGGSIGSTYYTTYCLVHIQYQRSRLTVRTHISPQINVRTPCLFYDDTLPKFGTGGGTYKKNSMKPLCLWLHSIHAGGHAGLK